jgi:hypothetical protein
LNLLSAPSQNTPAPLPLPSDDTLHPFPPTKLQFPKTNPNQQQDKAIEDTLAQLRAIGFATVVCTTASKGRRVDEVVAAVLAAGVQHRRRVPTATLNLVGFLFCRLGCGNYSVSHPRVGFVIWFHNSS